MKIANIEFPEPFISALRDGELVVFAGAGVSMGEPAKLPDFTNLVKKIAEATGESYDENEPPERFLGNLERRGVKVHERAAEVLLRHGLEPTSLHRNLLKLYKESSRVRIVTTNFDALFEQAAKSAFDSTPEVYRAPALPLGRNFEGIVHIHGAIDYPKRMVLTEADFGRAYLTEGWARRFLVDVFRSVAVLFVGYSHDDVIMNYLTRALPAGEIKPRFALTDESGAHEWRQLGIGAIIYPKISKHDYSLLHEGIHRLARNTQRSILDWKREITELAKKGPSLDEEEMGVMEEALSDSTKVRFFTKSATSPEWINWLNDRGHLDALFATDAIGERNERLGSWLAQKFACEHASLLFMLISKHHMRLNSIFWFQLGRAVGLQTDQPSSNENLSRWVSMLLATVPTIPAGRGRIEPVLSWLTERCIAQGLISELVEIFDCMAAGHLFALRQRLPWPGDASGNEHARLEVEITSVCGHYYINELWEKGLRPKLGLVAESLLGSAVRHLTDRHRMLATWQRANRDSDPASHGRQAMEPHSQDNNSDHKNAKHKNARHIDVLIDAARDCLEWLTEHRYEAAVQWCDRLVGLEAPLLRRLAVHTLTKRNDLQPDEKIDWLLTHAQLHDRAARHELFRALRMIYPESSTARRKSVIEAVFAFESPNDESEQEEQYTARRHFDWFHWLHESAPDCGLVKQALDGVWERYPDLKPGERPDFLYWKGGVEKYHPRSPWSVEELLSKPLDENWIQELVSFQGQYWVGPDRQGLALAVGEAANERVDWGLDLADELDSMQIWETDLWDALLNAWFKVDLDEGQYPRIFRHLLKDALQAKHVRGIATFLQAWVKSGHAQRSTEMLSQANRVAENLWSRIDQKLPIGSIDNWVHQAINHPSGILVEFWMVSLSLWRRQQEQCPQRMGEQYSGVLTLIAQEQSFAARLGRCILGDRLSFLLAADENWTRDNLLPWLTKHDALDDYQAVWDGFLHAPSLNPQVADFISDAFLEAISRIRTHFTNEESGNRERADRFIGTYAAMLAYYAPDPLETWTPKLFEHCNDGDRRHFAYVIRDYLADMTGAQRLEWWRRWLSSYWRNRLQGVPAPFTSAEIGPMLDWLPWLTESFPEAVDMATEMRKAQIEHSLALHEIDSHDLWRVHPRSVAKLLIYLGECELPPYEWHNRRQLFNNLLQSDLPRDLKQGLQELAAKLGLQ